MSGKQKKEVEKKFKPNTNNKAGFIRCLKAMNAELINNTREVDTYFNVADRDSLTTKECLRVRESDAHTEITYKPPTKNHRIVRSHFAKKETNVAVNNGKMAVALLELLGNNILVVVDKNRECYSLGVCKVALDIIKGAGLFIEIEIETNDERAGLKYIDSIAKKLGLTESMIEKLPYRDIVLNKQIQKKKWR